MANFIDARVPLIFAALTEAEEGDAVLMEGEAPPGIMGFKAEESLSGHAPGCACCTPRNAAGQALSRMMLARAHGKIPFYRRVVAVTDTAAGRQAVLDALESDPLASGCFRLQG